MSHPELLKKFPNQGVQGAKPSAGVAGCPRKNAFFFFCAAAGGAKGEKRSSRGDPCNPPKGLAAPLNPAPRVVRAQRKFGMTHKNKCAAQRRMILLNSYAFAVTVQEGVQGDAVPLPEREAGSLGNFLGALHSPFFRAAAGGARGRPEELRLQLIRLVGLSRGVVQNVPGV